MDTFMPVESFDAVYLVDLCEPLLAVARKRFAARGWQNIHVLCQDATSFTLPEWDDGKDPKGCIGFVTMSYALSMVRCIFSTHLRVISFNCRVAGPRLPSLQIPNFYNLIDPIHSVLSPPFRRRLLHLGQAGVPPRKGRRRLHEGVWLDWSLVPANLVRL